jgi:hypothetical protein
MAEDWIGPERSGWRLDEELGSSYPASEEERTAIRAGLPGPSFRPYTDPRDLGSSPPERFGDESCVAAFGARPVIRVSVDEALSAV